MLAAMLDRALSTVALLLKQPLEAFCDVETADGDALVTDTGDRMTLLRLRGIRRMLTADETVSGALTLREGIAASLNKRGHALQVCYTYDPDRSGTAVRRHVDKTRRVARALGLEIEELLAERERVWTKATAWEGTTVGVWSRSAALTRETLREERRAQRECLKGGPELRDCQPIWHAGGMLCTEHRGFVEATRAALGRLGVDHVPLDPHDALAWSREAVYPETAGSGWRPALPGDNTMPRVPDRFVEDGSPFERQDASDLVWPRVPDQVFGEDALRLNTRHVRIGGLDWACVDMERGPETPRGFVELAASMRRAGVPFRIAFLVEGADETLMRFKRVAAATLAWASPGNRRIYEQLEALERLRIAGDDIAVKLRVSLATWAPAGEASLLRQRAAMLASNLQAWGVCQANSLAGDPLEGVMGSAPGLALASTAPTHAAPLGEVLRMLPWTRPGSPWDRGSVLFRTPEHVPYPYDPTGSLRHLMFTLIFGEPGHGKSVLLAALILGLVLSDASLSEAGAGLPLVGLIDVGVSAKGLILLLQASLPPHRRHEAAYIRYEAAPEFATNIFDTQVGCRGPLPLEGAFVQNFLSLACTPLGTDQPFEGMDGLIALAIGEVYRLASDEGDNVQPKTYNPEAAPEVTEGLRRHRIMLRPDAAWWDAVDALCDVRDWRLAGLAQRHAVPVLPDLIEAVRAPHIVHQYDRLRAPTGETLIEVFTRYVRALMAAMPHLASPTAFDTGEARVVVLDLEDVALSGSQHEDRQTELMYMLGRHILGRNMFLRPGYVRYVPARVREYHRRRFREVKEQIKRLCYDELHRAKRHVRVMDQVDRDGREGRKHGVQVVLSSQDLSDYPDRFVSRATEVFVLGANSEETNLECARRFGLSAAGTQVVRDRLKGPGPGGQGAPFLARFALTTGRVEQMLYNTLGGREIWALSTSPNDAALRDRLYETVGHAEAWHRLARIFPGGSAATEIERRRDALVGRGMDEGNAEARVIGEIADELRNGRGIGLALLKDDPDRPAR